MLPPPLLVGRLLQRPKRLQPLGSSGYAQPGSGPLGSFHNLRAPGSIHLPARYLDAAEEDDLEPDSENPDDDGNDEDAASEDSDFYPS